MLVAGTGIAIAFVPFNDRPLEVWIGAFVKAIYKPTIYLYQRSKRKSGERVEIIHKNMDLAKDEPEAIANTERQNLAVLQTLVATCVANDVNPEDYLADVVMRIQTHPQSRLDELLPNNWKPPPGD